MRSKTRSTIRRSAWRETKSHSTCLWRPRSERPGVSFLTMQHAAASRVRALPVSVIKAFWLCDCLTRHRAALWLNAAVPKADGRGLQRKYLHHSGSRQQVSKMRDRGTGGLGRGLMRTETSLLEQTNAGVKGAGAAEPRHSGLWSAQLDRFV